jgi:hypothetical protein
MFAALALLIASLAPCDPDRLPVSLDDVRAFTGHGIDKETAYQLWTLSFRHREVMEACVRGNNGADVAAAWAAECHWRSAAWSLLDDVLRCYQDEPTQAPQAARADEAHRRYGLLRGAECPCRSRATRCRTDGGSPVDMMAFAERWGLPAVIVLLILFRTIPQMLKTFKDELKAERDQCMANHREQLEQHKETRHLVADLAHAAQLKMALEKDGGKP